MTLKIQNHLVLSLFHYQRFRKLIYFNVILIKSSSGRVLVLVLWQLGLDDLRDGFCNYCNFIFHRLSCLSGYLWINQVGTNFDEQEIHVSCCIFNMFCNVVYKIWYQWWLKPRGNRQIPPNIIHNVKHSVVHYNC